MGDNSWRGRRMRQGGGGRRAAALSGAAQMKTAKGRLAQAGLCRGWRPAAGDGDGVGVVVGGGIDLLGWLLVKAVSGGRGLDVCRGNCWDLWFPAKFGEMVHVVGCSERSCCRTNRDDGVPCGGESGRGEMQRAAREDEG